MLEEAGVVCVDCGFCIFKAAAIVFCCKTTSGKSPPYEQTPANDTSIPARHLDLQRKEVVAGRSKRPRRTPAWQQEAQTPPCTVNTAAANASITAGGPSTEQQPFTQDPHACVAGPGNSEADQSRSVALLQRRARRPQRDEQTLVPSQQVSPLKAADTAPQPDLQAYSAHAAAGTGHLAPLSPQQPSTAQWDPGISPRRPAARRLTIETTDAAAEHALAAHVCTAPPQQDNKTAAGHTQSAAAAVCDAEKAFVPSHLSAAGPLAATTGVRAQVAQVTAGHQSAQQQQPPAQQQQQQQQQVSQPGEYLHPTPSWLKLVTCESEDNSRVLFIRLQLANRTYSGRLTAELPGDNQQQRQQHDGLQVLHSEGRMQGMSPVAGHVGDANAAALVCQTDRATTAVADHQTTQLLPEHWQQGSNGARRHRSVVTAAASGRSEHNQVSNQRSMPDPGLAPATESQQQVKRPDQEAVEPQHVVSGDRPSEQDQPQLQQGQQQLCTAAAAAGAVVTQSAADNLQHLERAQHQQQPAQQRMVSADAAATASIDTGGADGRHTFRPPATRSSSRMVSAFALHQERQEQQQQHLQHQSHAGAGPEHPVMVVHRARARKTTD